MKQIAWYESVVSPASGGFGEHDRGEQVRCEMTDCSLADILGAINSNLEPGAEIVVLGQDEHTEDEDIRGRIHNEGDYTVLFRHPDGQLTYECFSSFEEEVCPRCCNNVAEDEWFHDVEIDGHKGTCSDCADALCDEGRLIDRGGVLVAAE